MKKINLISIALFAILFSCKEKSKVISTEKQEAIIDSITVKKHLYTLASDAMEGRRTGTPGIEKAAKYIENEFKKIGLKTYDTLKNYRQTFTFQNRRTKENLTTSNIIGVLEGKSKKDEFVIISAHYDHLGIRKKDGQLDSIYNGANDNASGVTGVLALASYFKAKNNNERTIVFIAFTAEEMGLVGSKHFGKNIDASKFVAGINLEMIGKTPSFGVFELPPANVFVLDFCLK